MRSDRVALASVAILVVVIGSGVAASLGTEFTYQGILADNGTAANGTYDFEFELWDDASVGVQVGSTVVVEDVAVSKGRVSVRVDFGDVFDSTAVWLKVSVRDGGSTGAFSTLGPRQELTGAPQAQYAMNAATADFATLAGTATSATSAASADYATSSGNALTLNGESAAYYRAWTSLTGVPTGLDDGDDDTLVGLSCTETEIVRWTGSAWNCSADDDTPFTSTYVIGPVGTTAENGTALVAALAAIPTGSTSETAVLLIEPGTYVLPVDTTLQMKDYVDIQGVGHVRSDDDRSVLIQGNVCGSQPSDAAVIELALRSELRNVSVENTCNDGASTAVALYNQSAQAHIRDVHAEAGMSDPEAYGLYNTGTEVIVRDSSFRGWGGDSAGYAVYNIGAAFTLENSTASASSFSYGVGIYNSAQDLVVRNVNATTSGSGTTFGIFSADSYKAELIDVEASGGTVGLVLKNPGNSALLHRVTATGPTGMSIEVSAGSAVATHIADLRDVTTKDSSLGLWVLEESQYLYVRVENSRLFGTTLSVQVDDGALTVGGSRIDGSISVNGTGTATCAANWTGLFAHLPDTCP